MQSGVHFETSQTYKMELFLKRVKGLSHSLTTFEKVSSKMFE